MTEDTKIELEFVPEKQTKRMVMFREVVRDNEQAWSDEDVAIGPLYVKKQALEIGFGVDPETVVSTGMKLKVTLELVPSG